MSLGLPGPLQTDFELKIDLPASKNEPDAATLTLHALSLLRRTKTLKYLFEISKKRKNKPYPEFLFYVVLPFYICLLIYPFEDQAHVR